jgi:D-tyrosyl-tRNA(Tyr) deacylase
MIAVVQRVSEAEVTVAHASVGKIDTGLVALVAVVRDDSTRDVEWMARKLLELRIFPAGEKHFDLSVTDIAGAGILLVSNFTVSADTRTGRRPSLSRAAAPDVASSLFDQLATTLRASGVPLATGQFGGDMRVSLVNHGPATFILDSASSR